MKTIDTYRNDLLNIQSNLLNYAYILTSDRDNAYSLLNETTSTVMDNRRRFDSRTSLKECAFAVMRTIFLKKYAHTNHSVPVGDSYSYLYHLNVAEEPSESSSVCVEESRLRVEINTLGEQYAQVYSMYLAGYTNEEIAEACSLSREAVDSRLNQACRRMSSAF